MPKIKRNQPVSEEDLALMGMDYVSKKATIKSIETHLKEIRVPLEEHVDKSGRETAAGSKISVLSYADKEIHIKKTLRVGKVLLPEALNLLRENHLEECIEDVPTVREDIVERLYDEGKISADLLKKIYVEKPTYAFSVEVKNAMEYAPK